MALSAMMKHYLSMKEKYPDCILFYRLGDFYEMFFDDAVKTSQLLDLTLTGKDCGLEERAPMCGIPFHAADGYIAKLVNMGEKVAICEQLSDPALTKSGELVERDVIKVVSAGTITENSLLDENKNNYLASAYKKGDEIAVAWTDITTGEFCVTKYSGERAMEEVIALMVRLAVVEVICNEEMLFASKTVAEVSRHQLPAFSNYFEWAYHFKQAERNLLEQFHVHSLSVYALEKEESCIAAAGALIEYLKDTQKRSLINLNGIKLIKNENYMVLDGNAAHHLELVRSNSEGKKYGSLLWQLDKTRTGMGARLLYNFIISPLADADAVNYRLDGVEELYHSTVVRMGLMDTLKGVKDIERLTGKISNGNFMPRDGVALCASLDSLPAIKMQLIGFHSKALQDILNDLTELPEVVSLLSNALEENPPALMKDGGYIKSGFNKELDELRSLKGDSKRILAEMEATERERTGIPKLKIGFNRVFGYYIEVTNSFLSSVPENYIRRQTLTTGERFITPELKELETKILNSESAALKIESDIFQSIKEELTKRIAVFKKISSAIALLDCLLSFATVAKENSYVRPKILPEGSALKIVEGRHPVVERLNKERFIPNDILLDGEENRTMILTGPNMAGKSTYMRQTALIVLMAQIGCFVPAKIAEVPIVDRIFTRVGATDNLILDQSTFMVEMTEVSQILIRATKNSLLILDEVGRGTSTFDGLSIAWAVIEYITQKIRAKTLFATHYHELTELEGKLDGVKNFRITVKEMNGTVVFLRKIVRGGANRSFGIEVASLAGIPKEVTDRAKSILSTLEKKDVNSRKTISEEKSDAPVLSEVESILKETDLNTLSPIQALMLLSDLKERVEK